MGAGPVRGVTLSLPNYGLLCSSATNCLGTAHRLPTSVSAAFYFLPREGKAQGTECSHCRVGNSVDRTP